jgi:hypothetical protein
VKEEDLAMELEMKPHPPPQVPSGTPAGRDASQDSPDEDPMVKTEGSSSKTTPPVPRTASSKKTPKSTRQKLKALDRTRRTVTKAEAGRRISSS